MANYRACRWYDYYPRLADVLGLIRLLPCEKQEHIGHRLASFLSHRHIASEVPVNHSGGRWYDRVKLLPDALASLETAPDTVKEHAADFLLQTLQNKTAPV